MASCLLRSCRIGQSSRLQKKLLNGIIRIRYSTTILPYQDDLSGTSTSTCINYERFRNSLNIAFHPPSYSRSFHSSNTLLKKLKEEHYERLRVYDPSGQFLCIAELLVLEKFCSHYRRYTFHEMERAVKDESTKIDDSANAGDNRNLRMFQLIEKRKKEQLEQLEDKEKKTKTIRFYKDMTGGEKLQKIKEILIDTGKVNIEFAKQGTGAEAEVKQVLQQIAKVRSVTSENSTLYTAYLNTIDQNILLKLFRDIQKHEANNIANFRKMMDTISGHGNN